jgi:hypothetical protein
VIEADLVARGDPSVANLEEASHAAKDADVRKEEGDAHGARTIPIRPESGQPHGAFARDSSRVP